MLSSVPAGTTSHLLAYLRQTEHATETSAPLLLRPRIYSWGPPPLFCRERCDGWGLVHQQPVQTQLLDDLAELVEIHRFLNARSTSRPSTLGSFRSRRINLTGHAGPRSLEAPRPNRYSSAFSPSRAT